MGTERVILGENCIYSFDPKVTGLNRNVAVVGGPGSGKTVSFGEAELIETLRSDDPISRIFICTKSRVQRKYEDAFRKKGFNVYTIDFTHPERGNSSFDPMAYIKSDDDIIDVATSIVMADERKGTSTGADPFWDSSAIDLLSAEIGLLLEMYRHPTFASVVALNSALKITAKSEGITTNLDEKFNKLAEFKPESGAVQSWRSFREAAGRTARSVFVAMNPMLKPFTKEIRDSIESKPTIDFERVSREKSIVFVSTSPVNKAIHSLANIFVARAIAEFSRIADASPSGTLSRPVHITFDDFATGARVADMPEKMSICREMGVSFSLLLQSESQLAKMYGEYGCREILDCCDSYLYLGGNNCDTARNISIRANIPLEDVLYMPVGREIVFRRGQKPIVTNRYNISADRLYYEISLAYQEKIMGGDDRCA